MLHTHLSAALAAVTESMPVSSAAALAAQLQSGSSAVAVALAVVVVGPIQTPLVCQSDPEQSIVSSVSRSCVSPCHVQRSRIGQISSR